MIEDGGRLGGGGPVLRRHAWSWPGCIHLFAPIEVSTHQGRAPTCVRQTRSPKSTLRLYGAGVRSEPCRDSERRGAVYMSPSHIG